MPLYLTLLALGAAIPLALSACGGTGGNSTSTAGNGSLRTTDNTPTQGSEKIRDFGSEAHASQAKQPEAALHGYLDARAGGEWSSACSHLSKSARRLRTGLAELKHEGKSCAAAVRAGTEELSSAGRADLATVDVESVRLEGGYGYVLYARPGAGEFAAAVKAEDGGWKVTIPTGVALEASE